RGRVHGADKKKRGRERQGHFGAGNRYFSIVQRLPENLQNITGKLRKFVQKEYAVVCHADLAGPGDRPAADKTSIGNGVMRRAKRSGGDRAGVAWGPACYGTASGGLRTLRKG